MILGHSRTLIRTIRRMSERGTWICYKIMDTGVFPVCLVVTVLAVTVGLIMYIYMDISDLGNRLLVISNPEALPRTAFAPKSPERLPDPNNHFRLEVQHPDRIFYNRIPKCGSRTVRLLVAQPLAATLGVHFESSPIYWAYNMDETEQKAFVEEFGQKTTPLLYDRHLHFVDFSKFGASNPAYINVVRDPLNQAISSYYFSNYTRLGNMSFDKCVATKHDVCVGYMRYKRGILPFFCGQDPICNSSNAESYEQACNNIKKYFVLVGMLEYLDEFFQLAEYTLPDYFKGASQQYRNSQEEDQSKFQTQHKDSISSETSAVCQEYYKYDIMLYDFIKERFFNTWNAYKNLTSNLNTIA